MYIIYINIYFELFTQLTKCREKNVVKINKKIYKKKTKHIHTYTTTKIKQQQQQNIVTK